MAADYGRLGWWARVWPYLVTIPVGAVLGFVLAEAIARWL